MSTCKTRQEALLNIFHSLLEVCLKIIIKVLKIKTDQKIKFWIQLYKQLRGEVLSAFCCRNLSAASVLEACVSAKP